MTYQQIATFANVAAEWIKAHPEDSKFKYALTRVSKRAATILESYNEQVEDISIEHAAVNKDNVILRDANGATSFTKDGLLKRNKAMRELFRSDVPIEPFYASLEHVDVTPDQREAFLGFVVRDDLELVEEKAS